MTTPKQQARLKRPELERDRPDRRPSGFMRQASERSSANAPQQAVEASVQGAYRVIQDYLRWGQRSAAQHRRSPDLKMPMQNPMDNAYSQALQMFTFWQQMYMQWMSMFAPAMQATAFRPGPMAGPPMPFGRHGPFDPGLWGAPPNMPTPNVPNDRAFGVTLDASHRVSKLWFQLQAPVVGGGSVRLRHDNGADELTLQIDESASVRICLGPNQAAGRYTGHILDRNFMHCGDLELTVTDPHAQASQWPTT